jgi:hypothetical protein
LFELVGTVVALELGFELELVLLVSDGIELGLETPAELLGFSLCLPKLVGMVVLDILQLLRKLLTHPLLVISVLHR